MSARKDIEHGLSFAPDVARYIVNAYSCVKGATDDPGSRMEVSHNLMEALLHLSCLEDEVRAAMRTLTDEPPGSPRGTENPDGSEIRGMVHSLARKPS
jgi:hypothetical protein